MHLANTVGRALAFYMTDPALITVILKYGLPSPARGDPWAQSQALSITRCDLPTF